MIQSMATFSMSTYFYINNSTKSENINLNNAPNINEAKSLLLYNDEHKGVIDYTFLDWALNYNISYDSIYWFITYVCKNYEPHILSVIKTLFLKYKIFFDETSNCIKFKFKGDDGKTNKPWYNDFVLGGIIYIDDVFPFDIDELFKSFEHVQKSARSDLKLRHIAPHTGEEPNRLLDILKSTNFTLLLQSLYDAENVYIHWSSENLLFYSLADIIESISDNPLYNVKLKNILCNAAINNQKIMSILAKYKYPNIKENDISNFCHDLRLWFIEVQNATNSDEYYAWDYLIQQLSKVKTTEDLEFITNNDDSLLIDNFVPLYLLRIQIFANSELNFDNLGIVQENIDMFNNTLYPSQNKSFKFWDSKDSKFIQMSDMIVGSIGALQAYINTHNEKQIEEDISKFDQIQRKNLILLFKLMYKSISYNMFFEHSNPIDETKNKYHFMCDLLINLQE